MEFTHFDSEGNAWMVDVSEKSDTKREAVACGTITMSRECLEKVIAVQMKKGDVLGVARIAGIMGAKRTEELIPLCHKLNLTGVEVWFEIGSVSEKEASLENTGQQYSEENVDQGSIRAYCRAKTTGKTGVEMEALTGVQIALLTIYDMCKAVDKRLVISDVHLLSKSGGKSGDFHA